MLTTMQQKFVDSFDGNAYLAAKLAGYSNPETAGPRLLKHVLICKEIEQRQKRERKPLIMSRQQRQQFWSEVARDEDQNMRDRLRASELLGKSEMDFTEKIQHSGDVEISIRWAT